MSSGQEERSGHRSDGAAGSVYDRLGAVMSYVSSVVLFGMMCLMVVDVVGRKAFNRPVMGGVELVELFLLISVYSSIPLVSAASQHIRIELLDGLIPQALRSARARVSELLCAVILLGCAWLAFGRSVSTFQSQDATSLLRISLWPFYAAVAVLLMADAFVHFRAALGRGGEK